VREKLEALFDEYWQLYKPLTPQSGQSIGNLVLRYFCSFYRAYYALYICIIIIFTNFVFYIFQILIEQLVEHLKEEQIVGSKSFSKSKTLVSSLGITLASRPSHFEKRTC